MQKNIKINVTFFKQKLIDKQKHKRKTYDKKECYFLKEEIDR